MEIDYDVSIFIITEFNDYILPEDYDKESDGRGIFVCLTNDRLNSNYGFNNSICIHRDWREELVKTRELFFKNNKLVEEDNGYITGLWQKDQKNIPNNESYRFNKKEYDDVNRDNYLIEYLVGYLGCKNIMSNVTPLLKNKVGKRALTIEEYIPAIMLTHHTKVSFNGQLYNGYLPAIGQLMFMSANILKINSALKTIGVNEKYWFEVDEVNCDTKVISGFWWSSSEYDHCDAWNIGYGTTECYPKINYTRRVLPLFAV